MGIVVVPSFGTDPVTVTATNLDAKVDGLATEFNGNIENANIKASAGIVYSKLNLTGAVLNADLAGSIADSKLSTITTAGKVSGAALTLLGNIPSAAGTVPSVNVRKTVVITITAPDEVLTTGDGKFYFTCPPELNGMNLVDADASVITASTSGTPTIQIARGRRSSATGACTYADMLSTRITIDASEFDSANAAAAPVIDTSNDDIVVSTYVDVLRIDVDVSGVTTAGLEVRLSFQTP